MYNKVLIIGNLGGDPEMRYTPQGTAVTNFSVAVNTKSGDDEYVMWFRVTAWDKLAETCNEYLEKGRQVFVEGVLSPDKETGGPRVYERNDGTAGASYEIRAFNVRFLGGKGNGEAAPKAKVQFKKQEAEEVEVF